MKEGKLTEKEAHVLYLVGKGLTTREIAVALDRSVETVANHRKTHLQKIGGPFNG